jgi:hypothetical protein
MVEGLPFEQQKISEKEFIRLFSEDVEEEELKWHFDDEDRWIEVLESTDWLFQMDNELPKPFKGKMFIPAGAYHRVIKGSKDFKVKITLP